MGMDVPNCLQKKKIEKGTHTLLIRILESHRWTKQIIDTPRNAKKSTQMGMHCEAAHRVGDAQVGAIDGDKKEASVLGGEHRGTHFRAVIGNMALSADN